MGTDIRSQLRALYERELPAVLDRAAGPDGLVVDRLTLEVFGAFLKDADLQREVLHREPGQQSQWFLDRVDEADAPVGLTDDAEEPGDCVRSAATAWVEQYFSGELAPSAEAGLWGHLDDCEACRVRYRELREEEGAGDDALAARTKRLARGLPWAEVPEAENEQVEDAEQAEQEEEKKEEAEVEHEQEQEHVGGDEQEPEEEPEGVQRFWLTRRGRWTVYGIAIGLFLAANALLIWMPPTRVFQLPEEGGRTRVVDPLPDQGLSMALLRFQPDTRHDVPWLNVQGAVAAGDRLLLTYSIDEGKNKEKGRPRFLTIVAIDDRGRVHWLRPTVKKPAGKTSPAVTVPARAAKLGSELRAPARIERLVIYAVVTDTAIPLTAIQRALLQAFRRPDFATTPPILNIDRSIQFHRVLDVLR